MVDQDTETSGIIDSFRKSVMGSDREALVLPFKPPTFVEVRFADGVRRRFAAGTKAGFAIDRINQSEGAAEMAMPTYTLIKAFKEGEDPVEFGPDADLVSYGEGWELRAVQDATLVKSCGKSSENNASSSCAGASKMDARREARDALKAISQAGRKMDIRNLWHCIGAPK